MAKHKYFKSPEHLWNTFEEYRKHVKDNPRIKIEYVGKDGTRVGTPVEQPLTIEGFKNYCARTVGTVDHYLKNTDGQYEEFRPIITRVRDEIREEQVSGGMTGFYNSNLTARINGLTDKQEINAEVKSKPIFGDNPLKG